MGHKVIIREPAPDVHTAWKKFEELISPRTQQDQQAKMMALAILKQAAGEPLEQYYC